MVRLGYGVRQVLATRRGRSLFALRALSAFGLVSGVVGFLAAVLDTFPNRPLMFVGVALAGCVVWGLGRTYPRARLEREFAHPEMIVRVIVGDLFDQETHIVVGFTDTFDTSTRGDRVINKASVQGQLVDRVFDGDVGRLDSSLRSSLTGVLPISTELRTAKPRGKRHRYPMGTVVVLSEHPRLTFAVALSRMGNDLVAQSSIDELWVALGQVWDAVRRHGQRGAVSIPLIGSGLSRVDALDRDNLARMILLSFVAHSRHALVARELRLVIHPTDVHRMDLIAVNTFLRTL